MTPAAELLHRLLAGGPVAAADGEAAARAEGISSRTLDRARRQLGVVATRDGGHWLWSLPHAKDATPPNASGKACGIPPLGRADGVNALPAGSRGQQGDSEK